MTDREILEYALREAERIWCNLFEISQRLEALRKTPNPEVEAEEHEAWLKIRIIEAKLSALPKD